MAVTLIVHAYNVALTEFPWNLADNEPENGKWIIA
jgi:hypothetical protein